MCGTAGMFVGCQTLTFCPKRQQLKGFANDPTEREADTRPKDADAGYRSPLRSWYLRAATRNAPRRRVHHDGDMLFFSPEFVPVATHPLVRALPEPLFRQILIQHLYRYLDFTAKLESIVVNRSVLGIASGTVGVEIPAEMRLDAYKIYCDEAYHTLMSADLARQVELVTRIPPRLPDQPFFLRRLTEIQAQVPAQDRALVELLFVVISETLISATLAEVPDDTRVVTAVRETVSDHATDEGRHHAFFAIFLEILWSQLTAAERDRIGLLVPRLIDAFLQPDLSAIRAELADYGISDDHIDTVLGEVFAPEVVNAHRSLIARHALRYFAELDTFESARSRLELETYGFQIPPHDGSREVRDHASGAVRAGWPAR